MNSMISVIVPVYCAETYLSRCLDSICNQTYQNLEIILVDDGSTDQSPIICDEYAKKDERICVIHQENMGVAAARNRGIDAATGTYISFIDADDYIHERMFETLMYHIKAINVDIAICQYARFTGERYTQESSISNKVQVYSSYEALRRLHGLSGELFGLNVNKVYKREVIGDIRYPLGKINEDEFVIHRFLGNAKKISVTQDVMYYYYVNNHNSITMDEHYLTSYFIYEAFDDRRNYLMEQGYSELAGLSIRTYLDRVMTNYQLLFKEAKNHEPHMIELKKRYRKKYKEGIGKVHGFGYKVFYLSPVLYSRLKSLRLRKE